MATDLLEIDPEHPAPHAIERAAAAVRRGGVVAIPTDALYLLVCDPLNLHAVGRIFAAKGRETQRALPLLVSDVVMAEDLGREISSRFFLLARHFCSIAAPKIGNGHFIGSNINDRMTTRDA